MLTKSLIKGQHESDRSSPAASMSSSDEDLKRDLADEIAAKLLTIKEIERVLDFQEPEPFEVLGPHLLPDHMGVVIRAYLPRAKDAWINLRSQERGIVPMKRLHASGFFQAVFENQKQIFSYLVGYRDEHGHVTESEDPYAYQTEISDYDLHLFGEGNHLQIYEKFGGRLATLGNVSGVHFAVWAPNAKSVSVVGNFNHWREGAHPMTKVHYSGIWALFVPGLKEGEIYKYAIRSHVDGQVRMKTDPYAYATELRPRTGAVVALLNHYKWNDENWLAERAKRDPLHEAISIYEVHLGSWKKIWNEQKKEWDFPSYRDLAHELVAYVKEMGYTHIELLPIAEHPLDESWGYQIINYYAPSSRFGKPEEFMYFVDHCHANGIGILLDWVPAHFPKDAHGLADFDGQQIYAYQNWKKAEHREWGTLVFDYGKNEIKNFLLSNALFWLDKYHVDGFRIDAVASMLYLDYSRKWGEWEPNQYGNNVNLEAVEFLKRFNEIIHSEHPGVLTIAEESTAWSGVSHPTYKGGLGFSMKWNMGWMHDTLDYFTKEPIHRKFHQGTLTFSMLYAFTENFILPISHDEVVFGKRSLLDKMPGDEWQKFANARAFLGYMYGHPGKKLLFMGSEFGQVAEWNCKQSLDWHVLQYDVHKNLQKFMKDLNHMYRDYRALWEVDFEWQGFEWVDFNDSEASVLSFMRWSRDQKQGLLFVLNLTPVPRMGYRLGVPRDGFYKEILNSDSKDYGGSGVGNYGGTATEWVASHHKPSSLILNLPPLAVNVFLWGQGKTND